MRLIHLADYGGSHSGSLVPMLRAACTAGQREGWEVELLLSDIARGRSWLPALEDAGIPVHFAPVDTRANAQAAIAAHLERIRGPGHSPFPLLVVRRPDGAGRRRPSADRALVAPAQLPLTGARRPPPQHGTVPGLRSPRPRDPLRRPAPGAGGTQSARAPWAAAPFPERDQHQSIPAGHPAGASCRSPGTGPARTTRAWCCISAGTGISRAATSSSGRSLGWQTGTT